MAAVEQDESRISVFQEQIVQVQRIGIPESTAMVMLYVSVNLKRQTVFNRFANDEVHEMVLELLGIRRSALIIWQNVGFFLRTS